MNGYSIVPEYLELPISTVHGVRDVSPLTMAPTQFLLRGRIVRLLVVGYDTRTGLGGPWRFAGPGRAPHSGELAIDETFARTNGLHVGDRIALSDGVERRIVALTAGTNHIVAQLAFGDIVDVRGLMHLDDAVSFFLVRTSEPASVVASGIERAVPGVAASPSARFAEQTKQAVRESFSAALYVVVALGMLVGAANVSLTIYATTVQRARDYGVLLAMGARRGALYGVAVLQSVIATVLGVVLGIVLLVSCRWLIRVSAPKVEVLLDWGPAVLVTAAALLTAVAAAWAPARRMTRLDAAEVFRA